MEFCEGIEMLAMYGLMNFTCDSDMKLPDGTTFSFQFLKSLPPIPRGNTKAWGSVEGCIAATRYSYNKNDIITLETLLVCLFVHLYFLYRTNRTNMRIVPDP